MSTTSRLREQKRLDLAPLQAAGDDLPPGHNAVLQNGFR
jgi:hypothetical protein